MLLSAVKSLVMMFPHKQFDVSVMYDCLKDLTDEKFQKGFQKLLCETEKMDASTNIIAIIRKESSQKWRIP